MERTQTYIVNCNGKTVGYTSITKNHPNFIGCKIATSFFNTINVFGNLAPQLLSDSFESTLSDNEIIEMMVYKINPECKNITFKTK